MKFSLSPSLLLLLTAPILFAGCTKEESAVPDIDLAQNYEIITPEPVIQGMLQILTQDQVECIYVPYWQLRNMNVLEMEVPARRSWLSNNKSVFLYSPGVSIGFESFFELDETSGTDGIENITWIREEVPESMPYPWILADELKRDLDTISSELKTGYPNLTETISANMEETLERIDALDQYNKDVFRNVSFDNIQFIVDSETMKKWLLENAGPGLVEEKILVRSFLRQTAEPINLEEDLVDGIESIIILTDTTSKSLNIPEEKQSTARVIHFDILRDGYSGPDTYFEVMVQNTKIMMIALSEHLN